MVAPVIDVHPGRIADVGGATVRRLLPLRGRRTIGAWCFLDHFGPVSTSGGHAMTIGPHPHTGLHTVTWLLDGELLHTDSLGSEQRIRPGELNLMTAGHGIAHAEDSRGVASPVMHGVQLWVAQPDATRHGPSAFEHHADLPTVALDGTIGTVLVGSFAGATSPARADTPLVGVDLTLDGRVEVPLDPSFEHGLVVLTGAVTIGSTTVGADELAVVAPGIGQLVVQAATPTRLLLLGGAPFTDDLVMWWNLVARSRDEIDQARRDWEGGSPRFGEVATTLDRIPAPGA